MNLTDIRQEIRNLVSDRDTTNPRWSDADLLIRINQGQLKIATETSCVKKRPTTATDIVSGTAEYDVPADFLYLTRLSYKDSAGDWKALPEKTLEEMDRYANWEDASGEPEVYIFEQSQNKVMLYPNPSESITGGLRWDYVAMPTDLANDSDIPFNSIYSLYPFHYIICLYVAYLCKSDAKDRTEANNFLGDYTSKIKDMKARLGERYEDRRIINEYEITRARSLRSGGYSTNPFIR